MKVKNLAKYPVSSLLLCIERFHMTSWAAIWAFQTSETEAMLAFQASLVGIKFFFYENSFFSSNKIGRKLGTRKKAFRP